MGKPSSNVAIIDGRIVVAYRNQCLQWSPATRRDVNIALIKSPQIETLREHFNNASERLYNNIRHFLGIEPKKSDLRKYRLYCCKLWTRKRSIMERIANHRWLIGHTLCQAVRRESASAARPVTALQD